MKLINKIPVMLLLLCLVTASSCKKYLDEKTDKKLVVPSTIADAAALMDSYGLHNSSYPGIGILGDDDFYFSATTYNAEGVLSQGNHTWNRELYNDNEWTYLYQIALYCNLALETLDKVQPIANNLQEWNRVKGTALFFRANVFYHAAQYYAAAYQKTTAAQMPGIPLRLDADPNKQSVRSSLQQTYDQIASDLSAAISLLPVSNIVLSRPNKTAAFGAMARMYLVMGDYALAKQNADSCLSYQSTLLDYNSVNASTAYPFPLWNTEVVLPTTMYVYFSAQNMLVDSLLYRSYDANDLRKTLYFKAASGGNFTFRGSYDGNLNPFGGIAVDELYLIRAEAHARLGNKTAALSDLNLLLSKRFKTGNFVPLTAVDAQDALVKVLYERRKEMLMRGTRWIDLRRLNLEPQFAKTLTRVIGNQVYTLPANDPRYTHYIPALVVSISGMQQNQR